MAEEMEDFTPPRPAIYAIGAMMALALVAAVVGVQTDIGADRIAQSPTVESRIITIDSARDGSARVTDAVTGLLVREAKAGAEEGFVWGAVNGLSYGRKQVGADLAGPYELARRANGMLTLTDLITGQVVFLDAFGSTNAAAWARLLEAKEAAR